MLYLGQTNSSRLLIPGARVLYSYCIDNPPCCDVYEHTTVTCEDGCEQWFLPYKFYVTFDAVAPIGGGSYPFGTVSIPVRKTLWSNFTLPEQTTTTYGGLGDYWATYEYDLSGSTWDVPTYGGPGAGPKGAHYLGRVNPIVPGASTYWVYVAVYVTPGCGLVGVPTVVWAGLSITAVYWAIEKKSPSGFPPNEVTRYCTAVASVSASEANVGRDDDGNCIDILPCQVGSFYAS